MKNFLFKRFVILSMACGLWFMVCLSGCSTVKKVQHLPQLLTIKDYSDSQDRLADEVAQADQLFDEMLAEIETGAFDYQTAAAIKKRFGDPVFKREAEYQCQMCAQWLYRKAKDFSGEDGKVYLYFNNEGKLINFEYIKGQKIEDQ